MAKADSNRRTGKKVVNMRWGFWLEIDVYLENGERIDFFTNIQSYYSTNCNTIQMWS